MGKSLAHRGPDNFSTRLYETLAMGRIPVLVDTDCLLPYANDPRWRECCVYIEQHDVPRIAEKVACSTSASPRPNSSKPSTARAFWQERLSFEGFFSHFEEHFEVVP